MMNLDEVQKMWQKDSEIDKDDLANESLRTPMLHCKYWDIYNTTRLLREKVLDGYNKKKLERWNYYTGKADPEVYEEHPFPFKVREKDAIIRYIEADEHLSKISLKIKYYDTLLSFLEEIIKSLNNRGFAIKNAIDWMRFQNGM